MNVQVNNWIDDEYNGLTVTHATITDGNGYEWEYDAYSYQSNHRELRMPKAGKEFHLEHQSENGYNAQSIGEALIILIEGGYSDNPTT